VQFKQKVAMRCSLNKRSINFVFFSHQKNLTV